MIGICPTVDFAFKLLFGSPEHARLEDVRRLFPEIEFSEAAGVLDMISQNPEQRRLYEARLKFQRDEAVRLEGAINEGIEKGLTQGRVEGRVEGLKVGQLLGEIHYSSRPAWRFPAEFRGIIDFH